MEEKILIKSKKRKIMKWSFLTVFFIGFIVSVILSIWIINDLRYNYRWHEHYSHCLTPEACEKAEEEYKKLDYNSYYSFTDFMHDYAQEAAESEDLDCYKGKNDELGYILDNFIWQGGIVVIFIVLGSMALGIIIVLFLKPHICKITITDSRIYGKKGYSKKINIPYESISYFLKSASNKIIITTNSDIYNFSNLKNRDKLYDTIKGIIPDKAVERTSIISNNTVTNTHSYPELEKYYCKPIKFILLSLVTLGIWQYVWFYKITKCLNSVDSTQQRSPVKKLLLCMFVPMYSIWWFYKSAKLVKCLEEIKQNKSDIVVLCSIFAVISPIIAAIMLQDSLNALIER